VANFQKQPKKKGTLLIREERNLNGALFVKGTRRWSPAGDSCLPGAALHSCSGGRRKELGRGIGQEPPQDSSH